MKYCSNYLSEIEEHLAYEGLSSKNAARAYLFSFLEVRLINIEQSSLLRKMTYSL